MVPGFSSTKEMTNTSVTNITILAHDFLKPCVVPIGQGTRLYIAPICAFVNYIWKISNCVLSFEMSSHLLRKDFASFFDPRILHCSSIRISNTFPCWLFVRHFVLEEKWQWVTSLVVFNDWVNCTCESAVTFWSQYLSVSQNFIPTPEDLALDSSVSKKPTSFG